MQDAKLFFTAEERAAIDAAVHAAETGTSGEIVPVLAARAGDHEHGHYLAGLVTAFVATLGVLALHGLPLPLEHHPWEVPASVLLPVQSVAFVLGTSLSRTRAGFHRAFLSRALLEERVRERALAAFRELGLRETRGATAIMLYVSLHEHVAVVLADKGISTVCPESTWDEVRDLLLAGLRAGRGAEGYGRAIARCGELLRERFPAAPGDTNELGNHLRVLS